AFPFAPHDSAGAVLGMFDRHAGARDALRWWGSGTALGGLRAADRARILRWRSRVDGGRHFRRGRLARLHRRHAALAEKLVDAIERVVGLAGVRIAARRLTHAVALGVEVDFAGLVARAEIRNQMHGHFVEEPTLGRALLLAAAEAPAELRPGQHKALLGARHADVAEAALFFEQIGF